MKPRKKTAFLLSFNQQMTSILPISTTANLCAMAYSQRMSDEDNVIPAPVARSTNLELAKQIQAGKIKQNTRSASERKVSILYAFLRESHPHHYDAEKGLRKLQLPVDVIAEFMAKISMVKSKNSPLMKQASCANVGGYRSAIVDLYKSNNLKFEDEAVI